MTEPNVDDLKAKLLEMSEKIEELETDISVLEESERELENLNLRLQYQRFWLWIGMVVPWVAFVARD